MGIFIIVFYRVSGKWRFEKTKNFRIRETYLETRSLCFIRYSDVL